MHPTLHNAEQRIGIFLAVKFINRTLRPTQGQFHRFTRRRFIGWIRGAFVELHHNVGIEHGLNLHRNFRREE